MWLITILIFWIQNNNVFSLCVLYRYTENPEEDMFEKSVEIDGKMSNLKIIDSPAYGTVGIEATQSDQ